MEEKKDGKLQKNLSPMSVWALAFGCIIGWGSFINPGKKFLPNSGVAGTAIAMLLGALVMVVIAVCYSYMVPKHQKAGGEFIFARLNFGKVAAFICGWFLIAGYLTNVPMNSTAIPLIIEGLFGEGVLNWFGISYTVAGSTVSLGGIVISVVILVLFTLLNIFGVKKAGFVQTILATLLAVCAFTLFFAMLFSGKASLSNASPIWGYDKTAIKEAGNVYSESMANQKWLSSILATFAIAPWAFVGFDTIPQAAEEFKFSAKKVIFIMVIAIAFGAFVYISNNTVAGLVLENWPEECASGKWVLLIAAEKMLGTFGKVLIGVGVSCAVLSGMMGFLLAASRLLYSMACDKYVPEVFSRIDPKHGTPKNAIIFSLIISLTGPFLGREALGWFVDMSSIGASVGFFFTCAACYKEAKADKDAKPVYKIFGLLGAIFSAIFVLLQLIPIPGLSGVHFGTESYIMFAVWIALGAVFYFLQRKKMN